MRVETCYKERWTEHRVGEYEMVRLGMKSKFSTASTVRFYDNFNEIVVT